MKKIVFLILLLKSILLFGYATTIGFGYANCMTCHYQPHGNGQLNDYGRALFASEIAAKPFWDGSISNETLGNKSSFAFAKPGSGKWKPSLRYRDILVNTTPGGTNSTRKYIMQANAGFAYHFDEVEKYVFVMSIGYTQTPINTDIQQGSWGYYSTSHEHYLRVQSSDEIFWTMGLFDIVYGIKIADHTASNRKGINQDANNQVHGILYNKMTDKYIFGLHAFVGNQLRNEIDRVSGISTTYEAILKENLTVGGSFFAGVTSAMKQYLLGFHSRIGAGKGSSLMTEFGLNYTDALTAPKRNGFYGLLNGTLRVFRGLDFETTIEIGKRAMDATTAESYRMTFGFIFFPIQRIELRLNAVDNRTYSQNSVAGDTWALQSQLGISL